MNEACGKAQEFLQAVFDGAKLDLRVSTKADEEKCVLNMEGDDSSLLLAEGGELLDAVQHLTNQIFGRELAPGAGGARFVCDVEDFRATREAELRAMAKHAASRVRSTGSFFMFGPMNANERRIIHTVLSTEEDLHTESVGEGAARRLRVSLKV
jgi:spoIIIJ-associated protein